MAQSLTRDSISNVEHRTTDYGFVLIIPADEGYHLEAYGMAGAGRYELFFSCACAQDDDVDEMLTGVEDDDTIYVYRKTTEWCRSESFGYKVK